jgi:hypothetical protein
MNINMTIFDHEMDAIGYIRIGSCENDICRAAMSEGFPVHAIPRFGTLDQYHFRTIDDATNAIVETVY